MTKLAGDLIRKLYSLVLIRDIPNDNILLGYKKRGFGMGKWNGMGGKVEPGESVLDGAIREAKEESGLDILNIKEVGYIEFQFESKMNEVMEVHVFSVDKFSGEIRECEEMLPKWFNSNEIPYDKMWKDDILWYPILLKNKLFKAYFLFGDDQESIIKYDLNEVDSL